MQPPPPADARHRLVRPQQGRRVAGVAASIGNAFGIDPNLIRIAFIVLTFASGVGIVLYLVAWVITPSEDSTTPSFTPRPRPARSQFVEAAALAVIVFGVLLLVQSSRLGFADQVVWPVMLAGFGAALLWGRFAGSPAPSLPGSATRADDDRDTAWHAAVGSLVGDPRRPTLAAFGRIAAGCVLVVTGAAVFLATLPAADEARNAATALIVFGLGIGLVFGPWLLRLSQDLAEERRARVRSQERSEIAAHVHDSVLHTLALVRRSANDPRQVVSLARRQERELRTWLAGGPPVSSNSLAVALDDVAATVETDFGVPIDIVKVGDCPVDPAVDALVGAAREAMVNAAKHSGAPSVAVYLEVDPDRVTLFVRDRGIGFTDGRLKTDRHGVTESIVGRMHRHGGSAEVRSRPGAGTEVELGLARSAP
jgi:signal transduction histidine kinase